MTEYEKKMLLSKEEYEYLMEHLGHDGPMFPKPVIKHTNYYFDTDDLSMNRQNTTCRIRLKDGKYKATMKSHSENGGQSTETEMEVRDGMQDNDFTDMGLKLQGELTTHRCIILKDEHCEVVLDKNEYLGHTDYELEIEYAPDHEKEANEKMQTITGVLLRHFPLLTQENIILCCKNTQSKSKRFFERKTKNDFHTFPDSLTACYYTTIPN